ncbi:MAG: phosphodiester glycosidase family protein [Clostridia bacterium]|nr:phosphodiester glycosidase family protein [Clostridia bacterium]MDD4386699.1 phosphodiester glycosidase family protein [Clostridia bacterium]
MKKLKMFGMFILSQVILIPILSIILIYYGPFTNIKEMIVTTAMTTMSHQYFATLFLSDTEISQILEKNRPNGDIADQVVEDIQVSENNTDGIELKDVSSKTFKGYLLIVNDPSRVKLATAPKLGKVGATTSQIVEYYDGVAGINAGGFADDALGTGGKPSGILISFGELKSTKSIGSYSIVGLDKSDRMIVSNSMTYSNMVSKNIRDAVTFGPTIIVNGIPTIRSGNGGWGIQPRTAIGQRKDGTILMLVIDGRQADSLGATLKNVQDIFLQYGAYNAYNLDGGASSTMIYDLKLVNTPSDTLGERYVPCAFIVTKPNFDSNSEKSAE